jgi:acyl carrier protein
LEKSLDIESKVRDYIVRHLMLKHSGADLSLEQPLLESGIMTSFGIVELVTYLEQTFGVTIDDYDVIPENFQTVSSIASLVRAKQGGNP